MFLVVEGLNCWEPYISYVWLVCLFIKTKFRIHGFRIQDSGFRNMAVKHSLMTMRLIPGYRGSKKNIYFYRNSIRFLQTARGPCGLLPLIGVQCKHCNSPNLQIQFQCCWLSRQIWWFHIYPDRRPIKFMVIVLIPQHLQVIMAKLPHLLNQWCNFDVLLDLRCPKPVAHIYFLTGGAISNL